MTALFRAICTATLARNADQKGFLRVSLHLVVFSNCKSAGCLGSSRRLLQADGARQTGPDWLQNMATHICLHHPTGDSRLVCQPSSGCGAARLGQYLGPAWSYYCGVLFFSFLFFSFLFFSFLFFSFLFFSFLFFSFPFLSFPFFSFPFLYFIFFSFLFFSFLFFSFFSTVEFAAHQKHV